MVRCVVIGGPDVVRRGLVGLHGYEVDCVAPRGVGVRLNHGDFAATSATLAVSHCLWGSIIWRGMAPKVSTYDM